MNAGRASVSLITGGHELEKAAELVIASLATTVVEAGWRVEPVLVSNVKVGGDEVGEVAGVGWLEEMVVEASEAAVGVFLQVPNLLGRQFIHDFPAFTQAQPLHRPDLLHLQHVINSHSIRGLSVRIDSTQLSVRIDVYSTLSTNRCLLNS